MTPVLLRGSRALALAALAVVFLAQPGRGQTQVREYWIAAVPVVWHVVPNERDAVNGVSFDPAKTTIQTVVYRRFTKGYGKMIPNGPDDPGIGGPLIHPCTARAKAPSSR